MIYSSMLFILFVELIVEQFTFDSKMELLV